MNKRIKAAVTAAVIAVSAVFVPVAASPAVYAAGQSQANENNTEFARAIINSSDRAPDRFLDKKYPDIAEKLIKYTSSITAGAADKYEAALKLYDWMVYNVEYKWGTFGPDSIGYILEKHQGTCTDFSFTFMAWLRYNGVKAWCATGSYYSGSYRWDHTWCVAEIGGTEYIFDPQIQNHTYERTGEMSHSLFCRAAADVTDNYSATSARYFNYDSGETSQTVTSYSMQSGNGGKTNYDVPAKEEKKPAEVPEETVAAQNDGDAPEMPEAVDYSSSIPAGGWEILTDADFEEEDDTITAEKILSYEIPYSDVDDECPFLNGVKYVSLTGLMTGFEDSFDPDGDITRAMLVTVLGRLFETDGDSGAESSFEDVDDDAWYAPYVSWASDNGFVLGFSDGTFRPDTYVTREQFYVIMKRVIDSFGYSALPGSNSFADVDYIDSWASEAVAVCDGAGLIPWRADSLLMPVKLLTRAELADAMLRFALFKGDL